MNGNNMTGQKHPRDDDAMISLYELYSGDLLEHMLSYASIEDLCTLDALSKQFQALTQEYWKKRVCEETGMSNGKEDWKRYVSFLREDTIYCQFADQGDHGYGHPLTDTVRVATNGNIVVMVADDANYDDEQREFPSDVAEVICVRDAYSLNFSRLVSSPISSLWEVAICGRIGCDIIVTSNRYGIVAIRGNDTQILHRDSTDKHMPHLLLGCDTHLVTCFGKRLELYRVETDSSCSQLLLHKQSTVATESGGDDDDATDNIGISWGSDRSTFVYCHGTELSVWTLDIETDTMTKVQVINYEGEEHEEYDLVISRVSLGDKYIIGASDLRDIHLWDRNTGEKLPHILCDEEVDRLEVDEVSGHLLLWCFGHILISSARLGNKLCIWDCSSGILLKEHRILDLDPLPVGNHLTDIAYLPHLNGFMLTASFYTAFLAFPINERQAEMTKSIKRREFHNFGFDNCSERSDY